MTSTSAVIWGVFSVGTIWVSSQTEPYEAGIPNNPPRRARERLSIIICRNTTDPVAPMALNVPISRMRSLMLASMMFMMPIPPTIRLNAAIMPLMIWALFKRLLILINTLSCVRNEKSSIPLWERTMTLRICPMALSRTSTLNALTSKSLSLGFGAKTSGSDELLVENRPLMDLEALEVAMRNFIHIVFNGIWATLFLCQKRSRLEWRPDDLPRDGPLRDSCCCSWYSLFFRSASLSSFLYIPTIWNGI